MSNPSVEDARRLEVHYTDDDAALVVEVSEEPDAEDVDELIGALRAIDIDDAEDRLRRQPTGPRAVARLGSHRRW
jgi:hypothetical protein